MKFDFCIGNPPYQDETIGDNKGFAPPVYNKFLDAAFEIADKVEMIHPARFLFDAGSTPKEWNEKMLNDSHFRVIQYVDNAATVFPNTDIKGGVAITYHDKEKDFGEIGVFTQFEELNSILKKVTNVHKGEYVSSIGVSGYSYHFTDKLHKDYPDTKGLMSKGHESDLKSNCMEKIPFIFHDKKPTDGNDYIIIIGRVENERVQKYIRREYINTVSNLDKYKLMLPKASGIGLFGETLAPAIIAKPGTGHTETFFTIGCFDTEEEAKNLYKYLKGKFARALLSISKKTQMITPGNFKFIPIQDFSSSSKIDWTKEPNEIDKQMYYIYGLSEEEKHFIESHVKEMA